MIVRWDDVEVGQDIGLAAGAVNVGLHRVEIAPEETAAQADAPVEEIVFVLEGSGSWENGDESSEVRPGDCGVRLAQDRDHLLRAGKDGLTVLAFVSPLARKLYSRPTARKPNIVNVESVEPDYEGDAGKVGGPRQKGRSSSRRSELGSPRAREDRSAATSPFRRRGGLRHPRRRRNARALALSRPRRGRPPYGTRRAPDQRRRRRLEAAEHRNRPLLCGPGTKASPSSPTGRGSPTTFAITPGRTRSSGGGSA